MDKIPLTRIGHIKIKEQLQFLKSKERPRISNSIAEARAHGDLKENAEYHSAKEKQGHIEGRIAELQSKIASANVVDVAKLSNDKIVFGATVTLFNEEKDESKTVQIVGEDEAPTDNDKISFNSPLGKALIGKEEGDEVVVRAPKGDVIYIIEEFEYK